MIKALILLIYTFYSITHLPFDYVPTVEEYVSPHDYEPQLMHVTWYLPTGNKTADGTEPYIGICASNKKNLGKVAILYDKDTKEYITTLEIRDTGGAKKLKSGKGIDIFVFTEDEMYEQVKRMGTEVYVQIVEADG